VGVASPPFTGLLGTGVGVVELALEMVVVLEDVTLELLEDSVDEVASSVEVLSADGAVSVGLLIEVAAASVRSDVLVGSSSGSFGSFGSFGSSGFGVGVGSGAFSVVVASGKSKLDRISRGSAGAAAGAAHTRSAIKERTSSMSWRILEGVTCERRPARSHLKERLW
jgi:hypothetical protein